MAPACNVAGQYRRLAWTTAASASSCSTPSGEEILDFSYDNNWYPITDGLGFSLVVVDENAEPDAWDRRANWRAQRRSSSGSPGAADPGAARHRARPDQRGAHAHRHPAAHRQHRALQPDRPTDVDLGGWFLTDDFNTPKKFRIPDGTMIAAGGYRRRSTKPHFNPARHSASRSARTATRSICSPPTPPAT